MKVAPSSSLDCTPTDGRATMWLLCIHTTNWNRVVAAFNSISELQSAHEILLVSLDTQYVIHPLSDFVTTESLTDHQLCLYQEH